MEEVLCTLVIDNCDIQGHWYVIIVLQICVKNCIVGSTFLKPSKNVFIHPNKFIEGGLLVLLARCDIKIAFVSTCYDVREFYIKLDSVFVPHLIEVVEVKYVHILGCPERYKARVEAAYIELISIKIVCLNEKVVFPVEKEN